jgi:hypothetical protein
MGFLPEGVDRMDLIARNAPSSRDKKGLATSSAI